MAPQDQTLTETTEFVLKKEQGMWKIDRFVNPLDGPPDSAKATPAPSVSPQPSASAKPAAQPKTEKHNSKTN